MTENNSFTQKIFKVLQRQVADLMTYCNAYSDTLCRTMSEEDYTTLYDILRDIDAKYINVK